MKAIDESEAALEEEVSYKEKFKGRLKLLITKKSKGSNLKFANEIGTSISSVNNWTKQLNSLPSAKAINDICKRYDVSSDWLVLGKEEFDSISVKRSYVLEFWINLWESYPEYCDKKILELYKEAYWKEISLELPGTKDKESVRFEKALELVKGDFEDWCLQLEKAIESYRSADQKRKEIWNDVDGQELEKTSEGYVPKDLKEDDFKNIDLLSSKGTSFVGEMKSFEGNIESLLRLFKGD
jgi:transcriptional regulator with XRE-family HTH domain